MRAFGMLLRAVPMLAILAGSAAAEDYKSWSYSRRITFNTTASGAGVLQPVHDFPVCVRLFGLQGGFDFAKAKADGSDLRFSDADGAPLAYEIERWDRTKQAAEVWVKVPAVDGNSAADFITMHWGKADAVSESDGKQVFPAAGGYEAVWHLATGGTGPRPNSVASANAATPHNYDGDESRPGVIGLADSLGGGTGVTQGGGFPWGGGGSQGVPGDYLDLGDGFEDYAAGFTYSVWVYPGAVRSYERFLDLGGGPTVNNIILGRRLATNEVYFEIWRGGIYGASLIEPGLIEQARWQHYSITVAGTKAILYKNGNAVKTVTLALPLPKAVRNSNFIGKSNWSENDYFQGKIDEPQISKVARDANWVKLAYESQRTDSKLLSYGPVVETRLEITSQTTGAISAMEGAAVALTVTAVSTRPITYQWLKDGRIVIASSTGTYAIPSVASSHAGTYHCRVSDGLDTVTSGDVVLKVGENPALWGSSMAIKVDTRAAAGAVAVDVDDFPLLIRLDEGRFDFSKAAADGSDLRFIDAAGSFLPYQIARWSPSLKQAEIWVRLPRVKGNAETALTMLWGRTGAAAASSGPAVFAPSAGWRGVYHLDEGVGAATAEDATGNGHAGAASGAVANESGLAGRSFRFGGGSDRIQLPSALSNGLLPFTLTVWIKETLSKTCPESTPACATFAGMELSGAGTDDFMLFSRSGKLGLMHGFWSTPPVGFADEVDTTERSLDDGKWHHVALVYDGKALGLYEGGSLVKSLTNVNGAVLGSTGLDIGNSHWSNDTHTRGFTGAIDEFAIASAARSADWLKLAYETQREDGKAVTYGASAAQPLPPPTAYPPAGTHGAPLAVTLSAVAGATIRFTLDGTSPVGEEGATYGYSSPITLTRDAVIRAVALRDGKTSELLVAEYRLIRSIPIGGTDTLAPGDTVGVGDGRYLVGPKTPGAPTLALELKPAPSAFESGFDLAGPLLRVTPGAGGATAGGLEVSGGAGPEAGVSVFRVASDGGITRLDPREGALWIPGPGDYVVARDISAPRLAWLGSEVSGDSVRVAFRVTDNVRNPSWRMRWLAGSRDSTAWAGCLSGDSLWRRLPVPAGPSDPIEVRLSATDLVSTAHFPAGDGRAYTVARPLPTSAPILLPGGSAWTLAALPADTAVRITLRDLAGANGGGNVHVAVWEDNPAARGTGSYRRLSAGETLPTGGALWLAADSRRDALSLPALRTAPSDSSGTFPIRLGPGWNLVANPSLRALPWPIPRKAVDLYALSPVKGPHAQDGNGYAPVDTLAPWEGYYVFNHGADTVIRLGGDLPLVLPKRGHRSAEGGPDLVLVGAAGARVRLGARAWAGDSLGSEDDLAPPPWQGGGAGLWSLREGRALSVDFVHAASGQAAAWTLVARGGEEGSLRIDASASGLPLQWQAWIVSKSGASRQRLLPDIALPTARGDTLLLLAGTPASLAARAEWRGARELPSAFDARIGRGASLAISLPSIARVTVSLWRADGSRRGGFRARELAAGEHRIPLAGAGQARGAYWIEIDVEARGRAWRERRVIPWSRL